MGKFSLNSIKSLIFEEEAAQPAVEQEQTQQATVTTPTFTTSTISHGSIDEQIEETFNAALEEANVDGFDYFEFKQSLKALQATIPDERTRFISAITMAGTMGATGEYLIQTAQHYLEVLANHEVDFNSLLQNQYEEKVTSKEQQISQLDDEVTQLNQQIIDINEQINQKKLEQKQLSDEMVDNKASLEKTSNNFVSTYNGFVGKINADIAKIQQYST